MNDVRQIIEIDAWTGAAVETLRYTVSPDYTTTPGDIPANTVIPVRVIDPGLMKFTMFSGSKTFGASTYSFGEVILSNNDKGLDPLKSYAFDGREIRLLEGALGAAFPSGYATIYTATIDSVTWGWDKVTFSIKGKQASMDTPVPCGIFQGNNVLPAGVEGGESLEGKYKPFLLGRCYNITPTLCNTSKLIYAVSPATGIACTYMGSMFAVYDGGVELTYEGTYSSQADMEANAPAPGKYRVWEEGGYFRLGSSAAGTITCDAASYGRSVTARPGNLIADLLTISSHSYDAASVAALTSAFRGECGVFCPSGETVSATMDKICSACGAYWYPNQYGIIHVGQLVDPATLTADYSISTRGTAIHAAEVQKAQDTAGGIPAYCVTLKRSKNWTVQTDVFAAVSDARKEWLAEEYRLTQVSNATVLNAHPKSEEMQIETCLTQGNAAEATRRAGLYSVPRNLVELTLSMDAFGSTANIRPGLCISLSLEDIAVPGTTHRYAFVDKKMLLIGYTINRVTERISATLWG